MGFLSAIDEPALGFSSGYNAQVVKAVSGLPLGARSATYVVFDGNIDLNAVTGVHYRLAGGESPPAFVGSLDGEFSSQDRVTLLAGRLADAASTDEAVMSTQAAAELDLHIGSVIHIPLYTDAQTQLANPGKPRLMIRVKMVGEIVMSSAVVESDVSALQSGVVIFSPALTRLLVPRYAYASETYLILDDADASATRVLAEVAKVFPKVAEVPASDFG